MENKKNVGAGSAGSGQDNRNNDAGVIEEGRKSGLRSHANEKYTRISAYVIVTVLIIYLLIKLLENAGGIVGTIGSVLRWLKIIFYPLAWGFVFAYLLYPLAGFLEGKQDKIKEKRKSKREARSSRGLAVGISWLLLAAGLFLVLSVIVSMIRKEATTFSADDIAGLVNGLAATVNDLASTLQKYLTHLNISTTEVGNAVQSIGNTSSEYLQNVAGGLAKSVTNLTSIFTNLLFAVIFAIYFMLDGEGIKSYWGRVLRAFLPGKVVKHGDQFLKEADRVFSGYIRGQVIDALLMAVAISIGLSIVGVKYAILIGILAGLGNLIPYVGPIVAYGSTILVSIIDMDWKKLIIAIIVLFIIQTIDGNVVNPRLLSENVNVHPVLVIVSLLIGGRLGGIAGMLLAVPCGALVKVYFDKLVELASAKKTAGEQK